MTAPCVVRSLGGSCRSDVEALKLRRDGSRIILQNDAKIIQHLVGVGRHIQQPIAKLPIGANFCRPQKTRQPASQKSARSISHSTLSYIIRLKRDCLLMCLLGRCRRSLPMCCYRPAVDSQILEREQLVSLPKQKRPRSRECAYIRRCLPKIAIASTAAFRRRSTIDGSLPAFAQARVPYSRI
jgi:hypothetical protein